MGAGSVRPLAKRGRGASLLDSAHADEATTGEAIAAADSSAGSGVCPPRMLDAGLTQLNTLVALLSGDARRSAVSRYTVPYSRTARYLSVMHAAVEARRLSSSHPGVLLHGNFIPSFRGGFTIEATSSPMHGLRRISGGLRGVIVSRAVLENLHLALHLDADGPLSGRLSSNDTLVLFGRRSGRDVVVHIAPSGFHDGIDRHAKGLALAQTNLPERTDIQVPTTLAHDVVMGCHFLVQSRLSGSPGGSDPLSSMLAALDSLYEIQSLTRADTAQAELAFLRDPMDTLCRSVPNELRAPVEDLVARTRRMFEMELPGGALVHGDSWYGNMLFDHKGRVIGIIDWEWARKGGAPLVDILHLLSSTLAWSRGGRLAAALTSIVKGEAEASWMAALQKSLAFHGLHKEHLIATANLLTLRRIWQVYCLTRSDGEQWLRTLLREAEVTT